MNLIKQKSAENNLYQQDHKHSAALQWIEMLKIKFTVAEAWSDITTSPIMKSRTQVNSILDTAIM